MPEPSELERVLAVLDLRARDGVLRIAVPDQTSATAAHLLREMALDFAEYATHSPSCPQPGGKKPCDCGLDAARERWRLLT